VGDELLRAVAQRLLVSIRDEDTVARIGGDEFGILLQQVVHTRDAELVAGEIVAALGKPFAIRDLTLCIGASVGVTLFPDRGDTYDSVISRADSAMYQAKADGRGRFQMYRSTPSLRPRQAQS
jgi:diguanylate cyclase (GGDEF)-like protein